MNKLSYTSSVPEALWSLEKRIAALEKDVQVLGEVLLSPSGEEVSDSDHDVTEQQEE